MGTSNLDHLIISLPNSDCQKVSDIQDHRCNSSSSSSTTPTSLKSNSREDQTKVKEGASSVSGGGLKIQIPYSSGESKVSNGREDPKTPTSTLNRIPITTTCPPAPRKAKRVLTSGKRKALYFAEVGVHNPAGDFLVYLDAMLAFNKAVYVPDIVVGDLGAGNRVKRLKALPPPAHDS